VRERNVRGRGSRVAATLSRFREGERRETTAAEMRRRRSRFHTPRCRKEEGRGTKDAKEKMRRSLARRCR